MFGTLEQVLANEEQLCLLQGNCLDKLRYLPDECLHCVVTSPPYWGLRDYMTGSWDGGDPKCDHLGKPMATRAGFNERYSGRKSAEGNKQDAVREPMGSVCKKCGARRVDEQLGMEEQPFCDPILVSKASREKYGMEPCGRCYVCHLVAVFRELCRVLRKDGVVWLNVGDSRAGSSSGGGTGKETVLSPGRQRVLIEQGNNRRREIPAQLKSKDLCLVPHRLAMALQMDGWWVKQELPWIRRDPMPESVTDRPGKAKEDVFMLARSKRVFFDMEAVKRPSKQPGIVIRLGDKSLSKAQAGGGARCRSGNALKDSIVNPDTRNFRSADLWLSSVDPPYGLVGVDDELVGIDVTSEALNLEHFAAYPPALVSPLLKCSTSNRGVCPTCGAQWVRVVESVRQASRPGVGSKVGVREGKEIGNRDPERHVTTTRTLGWSPDCECYGVPLIPEEPDEEDEREVWEKWAKRRDELLARYNDLTAWPAVVGDPFSGAGTTALVASRLGRRAVGVELNPEFLEDSKLRIRRRGKVTRADTGKAKPKAEGFY